MYICFWIYYHIIANFGLFVNVYGIVTSIMTISVWIGKATKKLKEAEVPSARLDAEVLLADLLHKDRSWLHSHPDTVIKNYETRKLNKQLARRVEHEPLAYIRGKQEFYSRDFIVSPDTLTPRPETETMIDLLLKTVQNRQLTIDKQLQIVDVGTGSGCIIITSALELEKIKKLKFKISYIGLDISKEALKIARKNAKLLKADIKLKEYNLIVDKLNSITSNKTSSIVLANLPYVPNNFKINLAASHEPGFAIYGGRDGLVYYRLLFKNIPKTTLIVLTESLPPQHKELVKIAKDAGFKPIKNRDLIHVFSR
jgi:release factor glutamine methyltransferase